MPIDLSNEENIVLAVVQEYLDKNRQFDFEKIIPFIISRFRLSSFNININGIKIILKSLIQKNLIVEGSKLSHDDILLNLKRLKIYNYILKNPGVYFNRIVKDLNLSNHIVIWHLDMLMRFNYIKEEVLDKHKIYFDPILDFQEVAKAYYTSKVKSQKILTYLKLNKGGFTKTHLAKALKMHPHTITKYLEKLEKIEIIYNEKSSNKNLYKLKNN